MDFLGGMSLWQEMRGLRWWAVRKGFACRLDYEGIAVRGESGGKKCLDGEVDAER